MASSPLSADAVAKHLEERMVPKCRQPRWNAGLDLIFLLAALTIAYRGNSCAAVSCALGRTAFAIAIAAAPGKSHDVREHPGADAVEILEISNA
jgi:hypothetical protein